MSNLNGDRLQFDEDVENLIVGFGFSAIPLVRELEKSGRPFTIISKKQSVWSRLDAAGRLNFDLVSSYQSSFYSFDLVKNLEPDRYPTAAEFYSMHRRYRTQYQDRIVDDCVAQIENHSDFSLVRTEGGRTYKAKNVVISTGFKRKIMGSLEAFDYDVSNKVVVFNTLGDSANLMISQLVPRNNEIICVQDGFIALDKMFDMGGRSYTLDQLEFPNIGFLFKKFYADTISTGFPMFAYPIAASKALNFLIWLTSLNFLAKFLSPESLYAKHDVARKLTLEQQPRMLFPNGLIYIKYWPIDKYASEFGQRLRESIKQGYWLNDLAYFIAQKLVRVWPKRGTVIDRDAKTIRFGDETKKYDYIVDGDAEVPNLPEIIKTGAEAGNFEYNYRDCYLGVVPRDLNNVYLIGYTRPMTGGLANITEMQGIFTHKLITDGDFSREVRSNLQERIDGYNLDYYMTKEPSKVDHLVMHGFYTGDVARVMGIDKKLSDVRSLRELNRYLLFPNSAFKYRETGAYKVEGVDKLIDRIDSDHNRFAILQNYLGSYVLYRLVALAASISLYVEGGVGLGGFIGLLLAQLLFAKLFLYPTQNYNGRFKLFYLAAGLVAVPFVGSKVVVPLFIFDFVVTFIARQSGFRYWFNDLKNKRQYHDFFREYMDVAADVIKERSASRSVVTSPSDTNQSRRRRPRRDNSGPTEIHP